MSFPWQMVKAILFPVILVYGVIPSLLILFPSIHNSLLFLAIAKWPFTDYSDLAALGVESAGRNFYLPVPEEQLSLGTWQILPKSLNETFRGRSLSESEFKSALGRSNGKPIFVYLHGNSATRAARHRVAIYNFLSSQDFHVLAIDYRGYADSNGSPSEPGLIHDAKLLYKYVKKHSGNNPVFLWGHSLGTAIATAATVDLCAEGDCPSGLVLESPFNNLHEVIIHHPFTKAYRWLGENVLDWLVVQPCRRQGLHLNTDERISEVNVPMLILHAQDDPIVPFHLATKLRAAAEKAGKDVTFIEFDHPKNYGHKFIYKAPELPDIVYEFVQKCLAQI